MNRTRSLLVTGLLGVVAALAMSATLGDVVGSEQTPRPTSTPPSPQSTAPEWESECDPTPAPTGDYCYPPSHRNGRVIAAESTRAEPDQAYDFVVGHCGLSWIVDFDASFWRPVEPYGDDSPYSHTNGDIGTIRLVDDRAEYVGSRGERVLLERIEGPIEPDRCY